MPGRKAISDATHGLLLESYRSRPGNHSAAAKATGLHRVTCAKAWKHGLAGHPAIEQQHAETQQLTRHLLSPNALIAERERAPGDAQLDAARQAAGEALMCRVVRGAAVDLLGQAHALRAYTSRLVKRLLEEDPNEVPKNEILGRIKIAADIARQATDLARAAMELERLRVGDPSLFVGLVPVLPVDDAKLNAEAVKTLRAFGIELPMPALEASHASDDGAH